MKHDHHGLLLRKCVAPIIARAAARVGAGEVSAQPLLLANWLADWSQFLLPLRERRVGFRSWLDDRIGALFEFMGGLVKSLADAREAIRTGNSDRVSEDLRKLVATLELVAKDMNDKLDLQWRELARHLEPLRGRVLQDLIPESMEPDKVGELFALWRTSLERLPAKIQAALAEPFSEARELAVTAAVIRGLQKEDTLKLIHEEISTFLERLCTADPDDTLAIDRVVRSAILVKAYFQFVHPTKSGGPYQMSPDVFFDIASTHLRPSFCHDHFDRPPQGANGVRGSPPTSDHGVYTYIAENRQIVEGLLSELERDWAVPAFDTRVIRISDANPAWYGGLAQLGYILHMIEDYFAHTNTVEHGVATLRKDWHLWDTLAAEELRALEQRRKRTDPDGHPMDEPHVVSGVFEGDDAFIAVFTTILDLVDFDRGGPVRTTAAFFRELEDLQARPGEYGSNRLREIGEIFGNLEEARNDATNRTAQAMGSLLDLASSLAPPKLPQPLAGRDMARLLNEGSFDAKLRDRAELATHLNTLILAFRLGKWAFHAVRLFLKVRAIARDAGASSDSGVGRTAKRLLSDAAARALRDYLASAGKSATIQAFLELAGSQELGSHSLLAKDEPNSPFFLEAMKMAAFVDSYVATLLVRGQIAESSPDPKLTSWPQVVGYFLEHPFASHVVQRGEEGSTLQTLTIRVSDARGATAATLAQRFTRSASIPERDRTRFGYTAYDWRVITDWNLGTFGAGLMCATRTGNSSVPGADHVFPRGSIALIPYQLIGSSNLVVETSNIDWWVSALLLRELEDLVEAFQQWQDDPDKHPLGILLRPNVQQAPDDAEGLWSALGVRIDVARELRKLRAKEELKARGLGASTKLEDDTRWPRRKVGVN